MNFCDKYYNKALKFFHLLTDAEYEVREGLLAMGDSGVEAFLTERFAKKPPRIVVHIHLYYVDQWPELAKCLLNIPANWRKTFVTLVEENEAVRAEILKTDPNATILLVENKGFDVGPFIEVVNRLDLDQYDYMVKLHSKRDIPNGTWSRGQNLSGSRWREYLLSFIKTQSAFFRTLACFELSQRVGMVGDERCLITKEKMLFEEFFSTPPLAWLDRSRMRREYISGTMFMVRADLLKIFQHKVSLDDFAVTIRDENTLAHAFELSFGFMISMQGKELLGTGLCRKRTIFISWFKTKIVRFFYQSGVTRSRHRYIKICRIPVYRKKV